MLELCRCPNIYGPDCMCVCVYICTHRVYNSMDLRLGLNINLYFKLISDCLVSHSPAGTFIHQEEEV